MKDEKILALPSSEGYLLVRVQEIKWCQAEGNNTWVHFNEYSRIKVNKKLKSVEQALPPSSFLRVHHSYLVNLQYVRKWIKIDEESLELMDGTLIRVSREKRDSLWQYFGVIK